MWTAGLLPTEERTMLAVGVDIIELERVAGTLERFAGRFLSRIYTPQEQAYCRGRIPQLAARFAAKEAVAKALGIGINNGLSFSAINIHHTTHGKPRVDIQFPTSLQNKYADLDISLSISDEQEYAVAFALAASL